MSDERLAVLDPASTALLVIDMQNAFVHLEGTLGISGVDLSAAPDATRQVSILVDAAERIGMPVIWTQQVHLNPDRGRERKRLASHTSRRARVAALADTWDAQLIDEFARHEGSGDVVVKHRFGAFYGTRLGPLLQMRGVGAVIVVGATANACVDTTIREAYMRDFDVVVPLDAVVGIQPEWKQVAAETWNHYFGAVTDTASVVSWLRSSEGEQ